MQHIVRRVERRRFVIDRPIPVQIHTASQFRAGPILRLDLVSQPPRLTAMRRGVRR